jgi:hypothetical protein
MQSNKENIYSGEGHLLNRKRVEGGFLQGKPLASTCHTVKTSLIIHQTEYPRVETKE